MGQLMVIAVSVDDGTSQSTVKDKDGNFILDPQTPPRVVGCLDSADFDQWVDAELKQGKMQLPTVHNSYQHLYPTDNLPAHVGVILFTHNSPGQICTIFHGVPICVP